MKLIKFEADWCNSCKMQDKELKKLKDIEIQHIDVDEEFSALLTDKYHVEILPTMIIVNDESTELHRFTGITKAEEIQYTWNHIND